MKKSEERNPSTSRKVRREEKEVERRGEQKSKIERGGEVMGEAEEERNLRRGKKKMFLKNKFLRQNIKN